MFMAQQAALDAGGLGLIKISNQAKKDGFIEEAKKAKRIAIILMVLMGIGVIVAQVESKITTTVTAMDAAHHLVTTTLDFKHSYPLAAVIIEILLLCARGVLAIMYGFTIHDLESTIPEHEEEEEAPLQTLPAVPQIDFQAILAEALAKQAKEQASMI